MINLKLIAFDMRVIKGDEIPLPTLAGLAGKSKRGEPISVDDLRKAGVPVAVTLLKMRETSGELKTQLEKYIKKTAAIKKPIKKVLKKPLKSTIKKKVNKPKAPRLSKKISEATRRYYDYVFNKSGIKDEGEL